jgi:uncharacterized protein
MLLYIIDGFNLFHKVPELNKASSQPHKDLLDYISRNNLSGSSNNKVTVVFDGYPPPEFFSSSGFKILYSCSEKADDVIMRQVEASKNRSDLRVVSDDRQIRDHARLHRAGNISTDEFLGNTGKTEPVTDSQEKNISYSLQKQITDEMRDIWLKKK